MLPGASPTPADMLGACHVMPPMVPNEHLSGDGGVATRVARRAGPGRVGAAAPDRRCSSAGVGIDSTMKTLLRFTVMKVANALGYVVVPRWKMETLPLETHLRTLFARQAIDAVLDVGANEGQYGEFIRKRVGYVGTLHSFEPLAHLAKRIQSRKTGDDLWFVHNVALGNTEAELPLHVMARDTFSSFREPDHVAVPEMSNSNTVIRDEMVPVRRLDDIASGLTGVPGASIYLKIDTQGFDIEVMRGAKQFLRQVRALQFELATQRIYKGVPHFLETIRYVEELGFDISGLFPIVADDNLRVVEFDCVMVRAPAPAVS
jgi:FkbM family methyltransferase